MAGALDHAKAHFSSLDRQRIDVPEWGAPGKPLIIYWTPATMQERRNIFKTDEEGRAPDGGMVYVRALLQKAQGENGKRLFDGVTDEADLLHKVDPMVVERVGMAILNLKQDGSERQTVDTEKNG